MKKVAAIVVGLLWLAGSGWGIWRYYDASSSKEEQPGASSSTTQPLDDTESDTVVVPNEVGKPGLRAAVHLMNNGLEVVIVQSPSVLVPERVVAEQDPVEGTEVPRGTVVELTISSGPP